MCTREYAPVCARRGGDRRTFGNACEARSAGYRIQGPGECESRQPDRVACPYIYQPVCGIQGGERRTFSNSCEADANGYRVIGDGACGMRPPRPEPGPDPVMACPRNYAPVCARRGGEVRTFGNACSARAEDFRVISGGPC